MQVEVKEENVEVSERTQSTITFGELPQRDVKDGGDGVGDEKNRTFSMEMHDMVDHALYVDEDGTFQRKQKIYRIVLMHDAQQVDEALQTTTSSNESESGSGTDDEGTDNSYPPTPKEVLPAKPSPPPSRRTSTVSVPAAPFRRAPVPPPPPPPPPEDEQWIMTYNCTAGCLEPILIRRGEALRYHTCGYRILYKQRTKRMV